MDDITPDHDPDELTAARAPSSGSLPPDPAGPPPWEWEMATAPPGPPDPPGRPDPATAPGPGPGGWQAPPPPPLAGHRRTLRRSLEHRILGGVAAGVADYLDIDVVIIRIAFVALTVLGGSGVLLYAAGWLLIPADDTGRAVVQQYMESRPRRRSLITIVLGTVIGIIALSNLFSSGPWWPRWDRGLGGFGFYFGVCALALAIALVVAGGRRAGPPLRWLLKTTVVAVLALIVVAVATVFSVEALSGVPLRGGVGDTQWRPTTVAQVAPRYRLAIGAMRLNLSDVSFGPGTTHVTASVGIGNLVVELPRGTAVSVSAHSGLGDVQVFGQDNGGFSMGRTMQQTANSVTVSSGPTTAGPAAAASHGNPPHIVLDAQAGVGHVQVIRSGP